MIITPNVSCLLCTQLVFNKSWYFWPLLQSLQHECRIYLCQELNLAQHPGQFLLNVIHVITLFPISPSFDSTVARYDGKKQALPEVSLYWTNPKSPFPTGWNEIFRSMSVQTGCVLPVVSSYRNVYALIITDLIYLEQTKMPDTAVILYIIPPPFV